MNNKLSGNSCPRIIAGSGRSGTTWILDTLAETNGLRTVFEPLHPEVIPQASKFAYRYLDKSASEPELENFMRNVFSGKISGLWTDYRELPQNIRPDLKKITSWNSLYSMLHNYKKLLHSFLLFRKKKNSPLIIKFIRANLMLDWLTHNFQAKIIFVVRHPGAVAVSKILRASPHWDFFSPLHQRLTQQYKNDIDLLNTYLSKYKQVFSWNLSEVGGHTLLWCIENILPVYQAQQEGRPVFFYEDIVTSPQKYFIKIAAELKLNNVPDLSAITRPSQQAYSDPNERIQGEKQVVKWLSYISEEQLNEIDNILSFFNVKMYNAYDCMPTGKQQDVL